MGKPDDPNSVLDSSLRVLGTENLRVIDASIQPQIISSNIQSVCIAIGEMGSDLIKETWAKKEGSPKPKSKGQTVITN
jgi:choline dehydrogenase-like flavoprotein